MNRFKWLLILLLVCFDIASRAQSKPMPTFNYLTIDLNTGHPSLYWSQPAYDPLFPGWPAGYIIYKKVTDALNPLGRYEALPDTIKDPLQTFYTDYNANGNLERLTYVIASKGPGVVEPSQISLPHSNIFISSEYDSCNHKIDLVWENYQGWGNKIEKYNVYVGTTADFTTYQLYKTLPGTTNRVSIINVIENQDYYAYVEAKKLDDTYITRSNLYHRYTKMPKHPANMFIDSIVAEDRRTKLYFKIDQTEMKKFDIVRWENADSVKSIFSKKTIHTFSDPTKTFYADTVDSWAARTRPFYYKIDASNGCPIIVKTTNHSNSITPKVQSEGMKNTIKWDQLYIDTSRLLKGNYARYRVIRYAYTTDPQPAVYLPETTELELTDDVHSFEGQGYSITFCYQIEGFEKNPLGATVVLSRSRTQCTEIIPGVIMPNAIIPTDSYSGNGNSRNILVPIITFTANYTLSVYNRWGSLIFNGNNEGWNGRLADGKLAKEGAYIYRLVVHTSGNRDVVKTGSVTVVYH